MDNFCTVSDGNSLSFVERKEWSSAGTADEEAELLKGYMVVDKLVTVSGLYLVLRDMCPGMLIDEAYLLAKFVSNEETGKVELHSMNVTKSQARNFIRCGEWFN